MAKMIISHKEFEAYCESGENTVSDLDYCYNPNTGEYDLPSIEWETGLGRYWQTFETEEQRTEALKSNEANMNAWVLDWRKGAKARAEAKKQANLAKIRKQHDYYYNNYTLGGAFPELKNLVFA